MDEKEDQYCIFCIIYWIICNDYMGSFVEKCSNVIINLCG